MKTPALLLHSLAISLLLAGCSGTETASVPAEPASRTDADIRAVLAMQSRGEISETQALRLIAELRGVTVALPGAAPATNPVTTTPVVAAPAVPRSSETVAVASVSTAVASSPDAYKPGAKVAGRLRSVGSDSMDRLMEDWTKNFVILNPELRVSHEGRGSSTAVPALLEGRADIGPMSRPLKREEIDGFRAKFGYAPTQVRVAVDALAIYVHPANPILRTGLTLKQLDAIFSAAPKRGGAKVVTWGDLGLSGDWKGAPVRVFSRNSASGTYGFFRDEVLSKGEFREGVSFLPGSAELVSAVGADKYAIGYSGIGYKTAEVGAVKVAANETSGYKEPAESNALDGTYPIARSLFLTLNRKPGEAASDLQREFVTYVLSAEGRAAVRREGYFSVPEKEVPAELRKIR